MFPSRIGDRIYLQKVWFFGRIFYWIPMPKFLNSLIVTMYQGKQLREQNWCIDAVYPKEFGKNLWRPFD